MYRQIKRKRDNLKDVILYENITKHNDSILALVNMSNDDREEYFKSYIDELRRIEEKRKKEEKKQTDLAHRTFLISNQRHMIRHYFILQP